MPAYCCQPSVSIVGCTTAFAVAIQSNSGFAAALTLAADVDSGRDGEGGRSGL